MLLVLKEYVHTSFRRIYIFTIFFTQLLFSFSPPFLGETDVMLDDISFENCGEGDIPAGSDQLSCDFEEDTCSWYHDYTASLLWKRSNRKFSDGPTGNGGYLTESKNLV